MSRERNWKLCYEGASDQLETLKQELIVAYCVLATIAIDGKCDNVEKEFLAKMADSCCPYDPQDVLTDTRKGEFKWWNYGGRNSGGEPSG